MKLLAFILAIIATVMVTLSAIKWDNVPEHLKNEEFLIKVSTNLIAGILYIIAALILK